jgi:ABC-type phosphate transport system substrate-binding protein
MARLPSLALASLLLAAPAALPGAEPRLVIVVNFDSGVTQVTREEVRNIFLGRQKRLSSGLPAVPVEQQDPPGIREHFYRLLVNKDLAEISAYWARLYFTGQAHPPRGEHSAEEVIRTVAANRNAIGLVEWGRMDGRVRVVLDVDAPETR